MRPSLARLAPHLPLPTPLLPSQRAHLHLPSHPRSLPTRPATPRTSRRLASSSSSTPPKRRTLIDLGLIGVAGVGVSGALLYQRSQDAESASGGGMGEGDRPAFTVPVQTGAPGTKTLSLLSQMETNAKLHEHESSYSVSRRSNPVFRYDTNALPSNSPIEDDSCCVILERDVESAIKGDLMFWGVFDGHSGASTSKLLSTTLVSYVARELDLVFRSLPPYASLLPSTSSTPAPPSSIWSLFSSSPPKALNLDSYDPITQQAIKNSFLKMDEEIVQGPVRLLEKYEGKKMEGGAKGMTVEQTEALHTLLPALSGSCALLAFLDAGRNKLHVACTGDSRAVMGTWEPDNAGGGKWRAEALSEDQTGKSLSEVQRIRGEHPANEADTVIARGRVLGSLEPSRAFGDARYKWALGLQERLVDAFHPGSVRGRPKNYLSPPYVTAQPEVVTVDLSAGITPPRKTLASFLPVSTSAEPSQPQATRFIVMATDGLYDRLDNEEIVSLVGAHLSGVRGAQSRPAVLSHLSTSTSLAPSLSHAPRQSPTRGEGSVYSFEDTNLSTHLIRNALGGANNQQVSVLLSIPAPMSRRYRDDITVMVILLGEMGVGAEGGGGVGGVVRRGKEDPVLAKL